MRIPKTKSTEQGLTLIESLAAIVIFGMAVVAISPPIALSLAARVRAHRAEQALNLAQGEIDRVRLLVEQGHQNSAPTLADFKALLPPTTANVNLVPTAVADCGSPPVSTAAGTACFVDINGNGGSRESMDFIVQSFRTGSQCRGKNNDVPVGFNMVVRVYTVASFEANPGSLVPKQGSLAFSGATTTGPSPLAVLSSTLVKTDFDVSSSVYADLLKGAAANCN